MLRVDKLQKENIQMGEKLLSYDDEKISLAGRQREINKKCEEATRKAEELERQLMAREQKEIEAIHARKALQEIIEDLKRQLLQKDAELQRIKASTAALEASNEFLQ